MRARLGMAISGEKCGLREVVLRNKPAEMIEASPKGTVPVLVLPDGKVLEESLDIMRWALSRNDPEHWLQGDDPALIQENDGNFKANLDRYKYPNRYDLTDSLPYREAGVEFLRKLDDRLAHGEYLSGSTRSLADMAIFPFVRQFAEVDRQWFDSEAPERVRAWLDILINADLFLSIMAKYPAWSTGDPEIDFPATA